MKEIKICNNHDYKVPLIWTFAFMGAEYWCPYCGFEGGMLGSGKNVKKTKKLKIKRREYYKATKEYLHAHAVTYATGTKWEGETIHPNELPQEEKKRLEEIRETGWKLETKVEDIKHETV